MLLDGTSSFAPNSGDAIRAAELKRVKLLATLVLAGCLAVFVTAKPADRTADGFEGGVA